MTRTHTIQMSRLEGKLLQRLCRQHFAESLEKSGSSAMDAATRGAYMMARFDHYSNCGDALQWAAELPPAFRTLPTAFVDYFLERLNEANPQAMDDDERRDFMSTAPELAARLESARSQKQ